MFLHIWAKPPGRWQGNRSPCLSLRGLQTQTKLSASRLCSSVAVCQGEQVQELNRHNKQGHCEPRPCQSRGWGAALPLLTRVPHLRRGPPNQEGLCSLLTEQPLGCLWPGRTRDSGGKITVRGSHTVLIVVLWGSLETIPQSTVSPLT